MPYIWMLLYNIVGIPVMLAGFYVGSIFNAKMREGRKARRNQLAVIAEALSRIRDRRRILFHCTSAGEWLQALPIIENMKLQNPELYIMVSFFSPSGFRFAKNPPEVDLKFYLPLDTRYAARRLFKILKPDLWIISKFDIWPNHVHVASGMNIPVVITSATLSADSRRDKNVSRVINQYIYRKITHFFPISEEDKMRFMALVPDPKKYTVAGDTRYDHVFNRGQRANDAGDVRIFEKKEGITLIAGSTWPPDEKHVLPAVVDLMLEFPDLHVIIVPHEMQESHLQDIEAVFARSGISTERYTESSQKGTSSSRIVLFNMVGLLARLYKQTQVAFIGGSFGKGTHNVMEPAIFGQPVLFGPNHLNSHEAGELLKIGAAFKVTSQQEFHEKVRLLICDEALRKSMGEKAKNLIINNTGATAIIIKKLKEQYGIIP